MSPMSSNVVAVSLVTAIAAAGLAGYALVRGPAAVPTTDDRVAALEDRIAHLERVQATTAPVALAVPPVFVVDVPGEAAEARAGRAPDGAVAGVVARVDGEVPTGPELLAVVDQAVEKKAAQMHFMATEKKPTLEQFRKTLELTEEQSVGTARQVVTSQHEIKSVLEVRSADGTDFMAEMTEALAQNIVQPQGGQARWAKLIGRLTSETVPGTQETYVAQIERIKQRLRGALQQTLTAKQAATLEMWKLDPTEIRGLPGSPWKQWETVVLDRARDLGAKVPASDGR